MDTEAKTDTVRANDYQVGGRHYKTQYEHWDLIVNCRVGYLEGYATKYLVRWRKTGPKGIDDLRKALHCTQKLMEVAQQAFPLTRMPYSWLRAEISRFAIINSISEEDLAILVALMTWGTRGELQFAADSIENLLRKHFPPLPEDKPYVPKPVPATDSNKHAEREVSK